MKNIYSFIQKDYLQIIMIVQTNIRDIEIKKEEIKKYLDLLRDFQRIIILMKGTLKLSKVIMIIME